MGKSKKKDRRYYLVRGVAGVLAFAVFSCGYLGLRGFCRSSALKKAETYLEKGFPALAFEALESDRFEFVRSQAGCKTYLKASFMVKRADRLSWAGESCIEKGIEVPEAYTGLAAVSDAAGATNEAIQILLKGAKSIPSASAEFYAGIALYYYKLKNNEQAKNAMMSAVSQSPDNVPLLQQAKRLFEELGYKTEAKVVADRLAGAMRSVAGTQAQPNPSK